MKRKYLIASLLLSLLALPATYNACGKASFTGPQSTNETVAGNPFSSTQESEDILTAICSVINRCEAQPTDTCTTGVQATTEFGPTLGLGLDAKLPYSSIESAENSGTIVANLAAANTCINSINSLSCSDVNVKNAYISSGSNPYLEAPSMVPLQSCMNVFTPTVAPTPGPGGVTPGFSGFVQEALGDAGHPASSKTVVLNFPNPTNAGDLIILSVGWGGPTTVSIANIADNKLNKYNPAIGATAWNTAYPAGSQEELLYAASVSGGTNGITITLTGQPTVWFEARAYEFSGIIPNSPLDAIAVNTGTSNTATYNFASGLATTKYANELIFGFGQAINTPSTIVPLSGPGFFQLGTSYNDDGYMAEVGIQSSPGQVQTTGTSTTSPPGANWLIFMATFRTQ